MSMIGSRRAFGRLALWCLILIGVAAVSGCSPEPPVAPADVSNVEVPDVDLVVPDTVAPGQGGVIALTATPSRVWGNGRALRATPFGDGRTAVVTTIGIDMIDGSDVTVLNRFPTTTLVSDVAASADGNTLAVATTLPSQITWYDLADGAIVGRQELAPDFLVKSIVFGPDAATLWVQTNEVLTVARVDDTALDQAEPLETRVGAPAISEADGRARAALLGTHQVVTMGPEGDARVDTIADLANDFVVSTRMSPSGEVFAVMAEAESGFDEDLKRVVVLDASAMVPRAELTLAPTASSRAWALSDTHLAVANGADVELHTLDSTGMILLDGLEGPRSDQAHVFIVDDAVVGVLDDGTILRWTSNKSVAEILASSTGRLLESASLVPGQQQRGCYRSIRRRHVSAAGAD